MGQEVLFRGGPLNGRIQMHENYPEMITVVVDGTPHAYVRDNPQAWGPAPSRDYPIYDYSGTATG
jgi:hypothetical protein